MDQKLKNKKILILGGSGFIGSNLAKNLTQSKAHLTLFQRKKTKPISGCLYSYGDISNQGILSQLIKKKFDIIFHCAGFSGEINNQNNPTQSIAINYLATKNLFDLVRQYSPFTKIIICSSRLEYGKAITKKVSETHPTKPLGFYGISKLLSTFYAFHMHQQHKLTTVVLRISNTYGPCLPSAFNHYNIINHFIHRAKNNKTLYIFGQGNQMRDYLFIDDLVGALIVSAVNKKANGQIYNVGFGQGITFQDMVKKIAAQSGVKIKYKSWPSDYAAVETGDYISNIRKIKHHLNWGPKINFDTGIKLSLNTENIHAEK